MITLITGLPGNGKTLFALDHVLRLSHPKGGEVRPVFYARIPEVNLPWTQIDAFDWASCPAGSIVVIDEAQKANTPDDPKAPTLFGVRPRGAPVPPWASALETHRHGGIDLVVITQDPMLLDSHDRRFVQVHYHLMRQFGLERSTVHQFTGGVRTNVATSRTGSIKSTFKFPRKLFGVYKSAELHTVKAAVPFRVWLFLALPFVLGALVYVAWTRLDPSRKAVPSPAPSGVQAGPLARGSGSAGGGSGGARPVLTRAEYLEQFVPRVNGLAYTAAAYDESTKPVQAPYPAACIASAKRCQCYTQQATRLEVPADICRQVADGGFFVAWSKPEDRGQVVRQPYAVIESAPVAVSLGGDRRAHILSDARK